MLVTDAVYCAELSRLTLMARRGAIFARARQSQQGRADDEVSSGETIEHNHLHVGRVGSICFLSGSIFKLIFWITCVQRGDLRNAFRILEGDGEKEPALFLKVQISGAPVPLDRYWFYSMCKQHLMSVTKITVHTCVEFNAKVLRYILDEEDRTCARLCGSSQARYGWRWWWSWISDINDNSYHRAACVHIYHLILLRWDAVKQLLDMLGKTYDQCDSIAGYRPSPAHVGCSLTVNWAIEPISNDYCYRYSSGHFEIY